VIARVVSMRRRSNARWRGSLAAVALVAASLSASARAQERQLPWPPASLEVCDALVVAEPDNVRSYYCYSAVVRAGRGSRDTAFARVAALLARRPPSPHALYVRALLLADRYDPGAEDAYAAAIAAYDASGDPRGQVRARVYLSTFRSMTGQERIAEPLTDAERIAKATGDAQLVALVTVEQAWAAYRSTDYGRATRLLESIEAVVRGPAASDLQSKWLSCRGAVHWALGDIDRARAIGRRIERSLGSGAYHTLDWESLNHNLFTALALQKLALSFVITIIIIIAAFNVIATLVMVVLDKKREIAILKAMGASEGAILHIFLTQGMAVGAVGTGIGLALGAATCGLLMRYHFPLDAQVYLIRYVPVRPSVGEFAFTAIVALLIAMLASLVPALWASKLTPVEGLRYE